MGRRHRPYFRVCAMDARCPRDGRVLEELGTYDPMIADPDARAVLKGERINYWLGVGAQPSDKVGVLIKKYGENGTHLEKQKAALEKLIQNRSMASRRAEAAATVTPTTTPRPKKKAAAPAPEAPAEEAPKAEEPVVEEAPVEAAAPEVAPAEEGEKTE